MPVFTPTSSNSFSDQISVRSAPIKVPDSVKLYLRPFEDGSYLLRLHNFKTDAQVHIILVRIQLLYLKVGL